MQANKLETQALLTLFENLQGTAREEFVREVVKRSTFLAKVEFTPPNDLSQTRSIEVTFTIRCGPQETVFQLDASPSTLENVDELLDDKYAYITPGPEDNSILVKDGIVEFRDSVGMLTCTVPYAACAEAFRQFCDWKASLVIPARTERLNVTTAKFEAGTLYVTWQNNITQVPFTHHWKFEPASLETTLVEQWETLFDGEDVTIEIVVSNTDVGLARFRNDQTNYVIRIKKDGVDTNQERSIEFIRDFHKQDGVINGGYGYEFNLNNMKSAIRDIIAYLKAK